MLVISLFNISNKWKRDWSKEWKCTSPVLQMLAETKYQEFPWLSIHNEKDLRTINQGGDWDDECRADMNRTVLQFFFHLHIKLLGSYDHYLRDLMVRSLLGLITKSRSLKNRTLLVLFVNAVLWNHVSPSWRKHIQSNVSLSHSFTSSRIRKRSIVTPVRKIL